MERSDKAVLIISFAVIILLFASGFLYIMKESEKDKRISLQRQADALTIEKQNLETKLKDSEIANVQIQSSVKFQEEKIDMLYKELEDEKTANSKNITKLQEKEFEIQNLRARIEESKAEIQEARKSAEALNEDRLNMKFQLENLIKTKEELEKKAKEIADKEGVSLGTVVIKRQEN